MTTLARCIALLMFAWILVAGCEQRGQSGEVVVAAASSMRYPITELVERFEAETGHTVRLSLGSSGSFFAQISNGAPYDVFLAADTDYPRALEEVDLIETRSFEVYGTGRIALWVSDDSDVDVERLGMEALVDPGVRRIAIANPRLAPYGAAAVQAMEAANVYGDVSLRIARAENIAQAAQFVDAGAADIGVLALSLVRAEAMPPGRSWEIPQELYSPIEQGVVILGRARQAGHYEEARAFVDMLRSPVGQSILEKYGFQVP